MEFLSFFFQIISFSILFHFLYIIIISKNVTITCLWLPLILKVSTVWLIIKDHFHANSHMPLWIQSLNCKNLDENPVLSRKQNSSPVLIKEILQCGEKYISGYENWQQKQNIFSPNRQNLIFFPLWFFTIFIYLPMINVYDYIISVYLKYNYLCVTYLKTYFWKIWILFF